MSSAGSESLRAALGSGLSPLGKQEGEIRKEGVRRAWYLCVCAAPALASGFQKSPQEGPARKREATQIEPIWVVCEQGGPSPSGNAQLTPAARCKDPPQASYRKKKCKFCFLIHHSEHGKW